MQGKFHLYIYHDTVAVGQSAYAWDSQQYTSWPEAQEAAKDKVQRGATSAQIFQLLGTAKRDIVIT